MADSPERKRRQTTASGIALPIALACAVTAAVFTIAAVIGWLMLSASLPRDRGSVHVPAMLAEASIELDANAVPTVNAASFRDALLAQGFLHAQQRFFQMDLARRHAAGELSALFGAVALESDREQRVFQLRERALQLLEVLPTEQRSWLEAYAAGVNAGLADLGARPPEYWLLRQRPEPWAPQDSVLVLFSLYTMMSMNHQFELTQGVMAATLPPEVFAFLTPSTSRFDALIVPTHDGALSDHQPVPVPGPDVMDLRNTPEPRRGIVAPPLLGPAGSNQWAAGAALTGSGRALLANDPHLRLTLPNVFYQAHLRWPGHRAGGLSIAGLPGIVIGASEHLAWGATVSNADQSDWVVIETDPEDPTRYRVPGGWEAFGVTVETITVRGSSDERMEVLTTRWGPVAAHDWLERPMALDATWLQPHGANLTLLELPLAGNVSDGLATLARWSGPAMNWMLVDTDGRSGWTVNGPLPARSGYDGSVPVTRSDGTTGSEALITPPALISGPDGWLFTANNRTLPQADSDSVSRAWMRPLRAHRIAELMAELVTGGWMTGEPAAQTLRRPGAAGAITESDFLAMQLDTRAAGYDAFRDLALEVLGTIGEAGTLQTVQAAIADWNGHADTDQAGFRLLHLYYLALLERVLAPLLAPAADADTEFVYRWPLADETLRRILDERPAHLLPQGFDDWPGFLRHILIDALDDALSVPGAPPAGAPWGDVNRLSAGHVFAGLLPVRWARLQLGDAPLSGSMATLRVAAPDYGATARMVIAPAAPERGVLQVPGGQSGHPLSPHFNDRTADWLAGEPVPFLPGPAVSGFVLTPWQD